MDHFRRFFAPSVSTSRRQFLTAVGGLSAAALLRPAITSGADALGLRLERPRPSLSFEQRPSRNHLSWVWHFRHDGSPEEIRDRLAAVGMGIALKTHDGTNWMSRYDRSPEAVDGPDRVMELAEFFETGGVPFHAWAVVKGIDPVKEAELASDVLSSGARTLFLDLEAHDGFWRGSSDTAKQFGAELRARQANAVVGTTIDARPWEVPRIPLEEFASFTDMIAPQSYWQAFRNQANLRKYRSSGYDPGDLDGLTARFVLDASFDVLQPFGLPVHPIGDGTADDVAAWETFLTGAVERKAFELSVWRHGVTSEGVWSMLAKNPPPPLQTTYVIQSGDTLGALASQWNTTVQAIVDANGIKDPNLVAIGQQLVIPNGATPPSGAASAGPTPASEAPAEPIAAAPTGGTYEVQPGDTLWGLARTWGTTVDAIAQANGITDTSMVRIGDVLRVP